MKTQFTEWGASVFGDLSSFKGAATGALAAASAGAVALGVALFAVTEKAAQYGAQIFEASEKTGLAAGNLSALRVLTKQTGENFDGLSLALGRMGKNIATGLLEPGGKTGKLLADLMGGSQNLAELGLKPMDERVQLVLARIFALNDVGERNLALQTLLGRGWMSNVETLKALAEQGYAPAIEQAKRFGVYYDDEHARQAKQFLVEWEQGKLTLSAVGMVVGKELVPAFNDWMARLLVLTSINWVEMLKRQFTFWKTESKGFAEDVAAAYDKVYASIDAMTAKMNKGDTSLTAPAAKAGKDAGGAFVAHFQSELEVARENSAPALRTFLEQMDQDVIQPAIKKMYDEFRAMGDTIAKEMPADALGGKAAEDARKKRLADLGQLQTAEVRTAGAVADAWTRSTREIVGQQKNFNQAMGQAIAYAIVYQGSITDAMRNVVASTLAGLAAQSITQALYYTALGFARLAEWDFAGAGNAFTSAAIFGAIGGAEALAGRAIAPSSAKGTAATGSVAVAPGAGGTSTVSIGGLGATQPPPGGINVHVYGHIFGISGAEELAAILSDAVQNRDVRLVSTQARQLVGATA